MRKLQSRQRAFPVLIVTMLLTIAAIVGAAYFGARTSALTTAQDRLGQDAQVAGEMVAERGQYASLQGNKLVVGTGAAAYTLSGDTYVVDHIEDVTGDQAILYRLSGTKLISVASTFTVSGAAANTATPARQVGDTLPGAASSAVLGHCGVGATGSACRGRFSGVVTLDGQSMMAGFVPLLDTNGKLVGAVGVARPLDAVLQTPTQLAIMLALVGLLVTLISLGIGTWILGLRGDREIAQLGERLAVMARSAAEVRQLMQLQAGRLQRQERAVRQVSELARELDPLVGTMEREQVSLRQSATDIWAEMSQPGLAPNPATALQLARASAVAAARVGATSEDVRARSRHLLGLVNKVIVEGHALTEEGHEAEQHAKALLAAIEGVETTLGDRGPEPHHDPSNPPLMPHAPAERPDVARQRDEPIMPTARVSEDPHAASGQSQMGESASSEYKRSLGGQADWRRPALGQGRGSDPSSLYSSGQSPAARPNFGGPPSPRQPGQGNPPPLSPGGGQGNMGRSAQGPGIPPQGRPPRNDDSQPGSNGRWLNG